MFRQRIQEHYEELTPRFRTLADFVLENTLDVGFLTATSLARRVGVDPATVVRFSQEIGYSGYRELSIEIKEYVNQELALRYKSGDPEAEGLAGEIAVLADELSDRILSFKSETAQIVAAVEVLQQADRIFVASEGESYGLAALWANYLRIIGLQASAISVNAAQAALTLRDADPGDLIFAISLGLDPDVDLGHLLHNAQQRALHTISITTNATLLPARQADLNLTVPAETPAGYPSFDTLMGLLSLIWQALLKADVERSQTSIKDLLTTLNSLVAEQAEIPPYDIATTMRLWNQTPEK
ncbi:MAG: MurR/RpiR family transcriptional regulator [Chloroflexota bacterium]|nr:MurR/RpiR family transcriptional regulator [Chloroflexota bacterium]